VRDLKEKTMGLTIVVGYDGSECAKAALDQALGLAGPSGKVIITYADAPPRIGASSLVPPENVVALGKKVTAEALQVARERGVPAEVVLENDRPAEALLKVAERAGADIIAVGTRGESQLTGLLLGSTPYHLVHRATMPLLVVPQAA
jgi:nucleotide-binding universal stress UspA family protein